MNHPDAYRTVKERSEGEFRDRGSKFLAYLYPCKDEAELKALADQLRKEHPQARHVCYGSILGEENVTERSNDDGEPGGTAGLPILNQLLSAELRNVALYIVRYFGGTKLGKSGLIHAYKESAKAAIEGARIITRYVAKSIQITFPYDETGNVMQAIERIPHARIVDQSYSQRHTLQVLIPVSEVSNALHLFDHTDEITAHVMDD